MGPILVIDDDRSLRELLGLHLEDRGFAVAAAGTAAEGERLARETRPAVIVLDVRLPDASGLELVERLRPDIDCPIVVVTAFQDMATTILAMKRGAFDFITKPIDLGAFDAVLSRALEHSDAARTAPALPAAHADDGLDELVGVGARMQAIFKEVGKVAASHANVLVHGESGTGKELLARIIHQYSDAARPFVPVNCAAIVESLLESELFGHERGAFTGAVAARPGKCELAADGTLFLDEIGDLSPNLQGKLLRVLQEREFERVGGVKRLPLRARVIAATHRDLAEHVRLGLFREDLWQRLKVVTLELPPLRERPEDIPGLVERLLRRINARLGRSVVRVPTAVMAALQAHPWPGNVRELENTLTRAVVLASGDVLQPEHLPSPEPVAPSRAEPRPPAPTAAPAVSGPGPLASLAEIERDHIARVLAATEGHRGRSCAVLGITRPTLERKLRKYGLVPRRVGHRPGA